MTSSSKLYRRAVFTLLLDASVCLTLFFVTGVKHESTYLNSEDFEHFSWDESLLDIAILAGVRLIVGFALWERVRERSQSSTDVTYRPSWLLRAALVIIPLASMCHGIAKLVSLELDRPDTPNENFALLQATIIVAMTMSFFDALLGWFVGDYSRQQQLYATMSSSMAINGDGKVASGSQDHDGEDGKSKVNLKRLLSLAKPELPLLFGGCFAMLFSSGANIAAPYFFGKVIDAANSETHAQRNLNREIIILGIVYLVGAVASFVRSWLFTWAGQRLVARVRRDVFAAIVRQDISFFDTNRTGELTNRLASDTSVIQNAVTVNISMLLRYILQILGSLIVMFLLSWKLTLVLLSVVPPVAIGAVFYGKKVKNLRKDFQDELAKASASAEEVISSMRTVRSFSNEDVACEQYNEAINSSYGIGKMLALVQGVFAGATAVFAQLAVLLVLWYGGVQVVQGHLSTGLLSGYMLYSIQIAMAFAFLSSLFGDFMQAVGASVRIFGLLDCEPSIGIKGGATPVRTKPTIALKDVTFRYPSRPDTVVLNKASFDVPQGSVVALVGPSGGGKSTIVALLERWYDPEEGAVCIGGQNVRDLEPSWLHHNMALVGQEPVLFAMSIKENIKYGKNTATDEEVIAAAKKANAHDFILGFEDSYDTKVGERGVRLSGGQKQRIAIARALLMDPQILLLDEATSALDAESEHLVQEAIDRAMVGRTVLVIAHRLSTVRDADQVLVISKGNIVEKGTHDELVAQNGIYHKLVERQLQLSRSPLPDHDDKDDNNEDDDNVEGTSSEA
eukprot:TRINITY_DN12253_c0_g1_i1.p1 TRINITY_DN12253_c0_g1~~TRINITY_DN12253_c0_g1_i1.p1  ORF type:complete len:792 (+),score=209.57 TRINITY_DN12253_c0_g1_i1:96-2471(+)